MRLTRRYHFSASHRLHSPRLSAERNRAVYGKCNNPYGHGHDYVLAVSVRGPVDERTGLVVNLRELDLLVERLVLRDFANRNMNAEIPVFAQAPPTTENVAREIERRLAGGWRAAFPGGVPSLEKIRVDETRKNTIELILGK